MKKTVAVLSPISNINGNVIISTIGTKAAPGSKLIEYSISWGDGIIETKSGKPPEKLIHKYLFSDDYTIILNVKDNKTRIGSDELGMIVQINSTSPISPPVTDDYDYYCQGGGYSGSGSVRMTDGSNSDIQTKIDAAINGDIICIPPGNFSWNGVPVWTDKDLLIIGAGIGSTNITSSESFLFFTHITNILRGGFRISNFSVLGNVAEVLKVSSNTLAAVPNGFWRLDHIHFNFRLSNVDHGGVHQVGVNYGLIDNCVIDWPLGGIFLRHAFGLNSENPSRGITITRLGSTATAITDQSISDWVTGDTVNIAGADQSAYNGSFIITVVDSNTFTFTVAGSPTTPATPGSFAISVVNFSRKSLWPGNFASSLPTDFGTGNFVFVEDCVFNGYNNSNFFDVYDASAGGGRVTWRHNSMNGNCRFYNHWTRGTEVAAQVMEIYNNSWLLGTGDLSSFDPGHIFRIEGGTVKFFNNYSNYNGGAPFVILDDRRSGGFGGPVGNEAEVGRTWELCDGTHSWDGNLGDPSAPGWPCLGQPGRGWGTSFVDLAGGIIKQPSAPCYFWNNGTQISCAAGGSCIDSIFPFADPGAYIRNSPHSNGDRDYVLNGNIPEPGYTSFAYPHPKQSELWP